MTRTGKRRAIAGIVAAVFAGAVLFLTDSVDAGPRPELKPSMHWVFDKDGVDGKQVLDRCGKLNGTLLGSPKLSTASPTPCIEFKNPDEAVMIKDKVGPDAPFLPKEAFSIVSWVRIDEPTEWGGILACLQDNGPVEYGFILGYNKSSFLFGLSTKGADDGDGKLTYLSGKTEYQRGKWYHVAAVYDGKQMRLYVNGQLDATSNDQSGPILYAKAAPFVIGRYQDDDEEYPMFGAIREVMLCPRVLPADQVAEHFAADRAIADTPVPPPTQKFVIDPYLQYATRTSMTIMWETDQPTTGTVFYGTTYPPKQTAKADKPDVMGEVALTGLEPKTKYFYRVSCTAADGTVLEGKPGTFMTAADPTDAYSFTVIGDTQRNPAVTAKLGKLMWERRPNFVVHCGDVVDDGAAKWQWTGDLFKPCSELFSRVPVYPCIGNHEKNHANYYKYFALPKPEYYYSYKYGNAEFFSVDTNARRNLTETGEQYLWLDKALVASDAKWKIVYHHHPVYSSDEDDYGNSWKGKTVSGDLRTRTLCALYEKHNVDIVFNGHIHLYERSWPVRDGKVDQKRGIIHITSGGGGGSLEDFAPTPAFFKKEGRVDFHFCYVTVHQGTFEFKAFDQEGRLFDHFSLKKE